MLMVGHNTQDQHQRLFTKERVQSVMRVVNNMTIQDKNFFGQQPTLTRKREGEGEREKERERVRERE